MYNISVIIVLLLFRVATRTAVYLEIYELGKRVGDRCGEMRDEAGTREKKKITKKKDTDLLRRSRITRTYVA